MGGATAEVDLCFYKHMHLNLHTCTNIEHMHTHRKKIFIYFFLNGLRQRYLNREKENLSYYHVQAGEGLSFGDICSVLDEARLHHRQDMFLTLM